MFVQPARVQQQQQPPQPKSARRGHKRRYNEGPGADTDPRAPRPLFSAHPPPMSAHNPPLGHPEDTPEGSAGTFRGNGHHGHDHDQGQAPLTHGPASELGRRDAAWRAAQRSSARPSRQGQDTAPSTFRQSQPEPQPYKKPRVRQGDAASRPTPSSQFSQSSRPSQSSQFYHPTAPSASGSQPVDPDFAHFEQDRDSMGEPTMRVGPCPSTADSPPPAYSSFQLGRPTPDDGEQSHKASARSDRRSKQRSDRATRQQTEVAAAQPAALNGRTHHKVTVLMEDQRPGRDCVLAEVFVFVAGSGGQLFVDAHDISDELQKSAQRIEGPAKLYTFRGKWKQYFLRVGMFYDPAVPVESTHQSLMLRVDNENGPKALLLDVFIEEDTSARPPNCWQCGAPCQPDALADVPHPRTSRASTREQEELMRAASRPRSTSELASPRSSYTTERPASTRPVESRHHSRRSTVQEPSLTPVSSRSQTKAPAADIRRTNTAQQQEPQSSLRLDMLATQAQDRISPVSDEDDEDDDDDVYDDLGDLGDFMPEGVALPSDASDASARTPSVRGTPAFGASGFGASFFEKYSKQGTSLVPPSAQKLLVNAVTKRPHPTDPDGVDGAVVAHLRQLFKQDPRWARFESYKTEAPQFKFLREMCYWMHAQIAKYAGKPVDVSPKGPSVTITNDHVFQAASFFPESSRTALDDLIKLDQKYGPNGTDGEDPTVMEYLEDVPSVETELALQHYYHMVLFRVPWRNRYVP